MTKLQSLNSRKMAKLRGAKDGVPFQKGDPRINREGRPKKIPNLDMLLAELLDDEDQSAKLILAALIEKAKDGDVRAAQVILDRAYGKPKESIDIVTNGESLNQEKRFVFSDGTTRDAKGNVINQGNQ